MKFTSRDKECPQCGHKRWKTVEKRSDTQLASKYRCRRCGYVKEIGENGEEVKTD